ncbi:MAG TPA: hypothetical protein VFQ76_05290, partial [Longimicrobiaceae bacterium]|nr:hypothetical protein [Longimicrobiaceae bacterium]
DGCHPFRMAYAWSLVESVDLERCATDQDYADQAVSRVDRAYHEVRDFPDALAVRAMLNQMRFNLAEAHDDMTRAIEGGAQSADQLRALRGMYRLMYRGDLDGAREDFAVAVTAYPEGKDRDMMELYVAWIGVRKAEEDALARVREVLKRPAIARELPGAMLMVRVIQPFYRFRFVRRLFAAPARPRNNPGVRLAVWMGRAGFIGASLRRWIRRQDKKRLRKDPSARTRRPVKTDDLLR